MNDNKTYYILVIDNDNGLSTELFAEERLAENALYQYVKDNWNSLFAVNEMTLPEDREKAIEAYFSHDFCDERAQIDPVQLSPK